MSTAITTKATFRRPFAVVYEALPSYPEADIEQAIGQALHGKRHNVGIEQMIAAVESVCEAKRQAQLQVLLKGAAEQARMTKSLREYQEAAERERAERRAQEVENLRRFRLRLAAWIDRRIAACEQAVLPKAA